MTMASFRNSTVASDHADNVIPAWRLDEKRRERAERIRLATSTIVAQAQREAATS